MTTRSVLIGIFATIILAIATPIGDFWIRGTWLASCHLPVGVLMAFVFLQLVVNPGISERPLPTHPVQEVLSDVRREAPMDD
jgi:hypothetical protein